MVALPWGCCVLSAQVLVTERDEIMVDHKDDGTPMPLANYHIQNDSRLVLRVVVSGGAQWTTIFGCFVHCLDAEGAHFLCFPSFASSWAVCFLLHTAA